MAIAQLPQSLFNFKSYGAILKKSSVTPGLESLLLEVVA